MSEKEQLVEFVNSLAQEEVEAILANFNQIIAIAETVAAQEVV